MELIVLLCVAVVEREARHVDGRSSRMEKGPVSLLSLSLFPFCTSHFYLVADLGSAVRAK